jgi:phosphoribosylanthranilate isomerase
MRRTRIKICGITRPQDARAAALAGADAIGMVFYPKARRCITIDRARDILREVPPFVTRVGLFVDQSPDEIRRIAKAVGIGCVQLHGGETPAMVAELRDFRVLKVLRADRGKLEIDLQTWRKSIESLDLQHLQGFTLETPAAAGMGGTGVENDWAFLAELSRAGAFENLPPIIAAGGLTPANVAAVVKLLDPLAVDVSSGVEERFGEKSVERINAFIAAVTPERTI